MRNMVRGVALAGLAVVGACGGEIEPCARLAAVLPGEWVALDVGACEEPHARLLAWQGGAEGIAPLAADQVPASEGPCVVVRGGPSAAALAEGPWCVSMLVDGEPEDALCVPEDVPGAEVGTELLLVHGEAGWVAALPDGAAGCEWPLVLGG